MWQFFLNLNIEQFFFFSRGVHVWPGDWTYPPHVGYMGKGQSPSFEKKIFFDFFFFFFFFDFDFPFSRYLDFGGGEFFGASKIPESETLIWRDRGSDIRKIPVLQGEKKKLGALTRQYDLR